MPMSLRMRPNGGISLPWVTATSVMGWGSLALRRNHTKWRSKGTSSRSNPSMTKSVLSASWDSVKSVMRTLSKSITSFSVARSTHMAGAPCLPDPLTMM